MGKLNKERAGWVEDALLSVRAFAEILTNEEEGGAYQAAKDFLCDFQHFCDDRDIDFDAILEAARLLHDGEVADDE
jgi:hypothetical protein